MVNIVRLKYSMRKYARSHNLSQHDDMTMVPVWGKAAQRLSYAICGHTDKLDCRDKLFPRTLKQNVVSLAQREVGIKEMPAGSNDGPRVHIYESITRMFGQAWCASFVTWLFATIAKEMGKKFKVFPGAASVPIWTENIRAGRYGWRRVEVASAMPGDVVTLWGSEHIELVISVDHIAHQLHCVGGNTSENGASSSGGQVCRTVRNFYEVTVVGRLA